MSDGDLPSSIRAEAAAWLARLHADSRSAADEQAFRAWLCENPAHMRAFDAVTTSWDLAAGAARPAAHTGCKHSIGIERRALLVGIGALVAAGASLSVWRAAFAGVYKTDVGEQKHVILSDGSHVFLDTNTCIRVHFDSERRNVDLERGRADFRVAPDPARPFVVEAADRRIEAARCDVEVSHHRGEVSVVLISGVATVSDDHNGIPTVVKILRGERMTVSPKQTARIDRPNLRPLLAWQTGQAIFENETLEQAVVEMNRYSSVNLVIADPAIAQLRLSGVYRVGDVDAFAHSVARLLPVSVREVNGRIEFVADQNRVPGE